MPLALLHDLDLLYSDIDPEIDAERFNDDVLADIVNIPHLKTLTMFGLHDVLIERLKCPKLARLKSFDGG